MEKSIDVALNVDQYIAGFPDDVKDKLQQLRNLIKTIVPEVEECISYGMPAYKYSGSILTYFAAYKKHIGLYAVPNLHPDFIAKFANYKTGRGSVQFPLNQALPLYFIKEIIEFRLKENIIKMENEKV